MGGYWYDGACAEALRATNSAEYHNAPILYITYQDETKAHVDLVHPMAVPEEDQHKRKTVYFVILVANDFYFVERSCNVFYCDYKLVTRNLGMPFGMPSLGDMTLGEVLDLSSMLTHVTAAGKHTYNFNDLPLAGFTGEIQIFVGYATGDERQYVFIHYTVVVE